MGVNVGVINAVVVLTCSLLFLLQLLFLFLVLGLRVEVVVAVLGELPLVGLVHQIGGAAREVDAEFLDVDFHDAAVDRHPHLKRRRKNTEVLHRCHKRRKQGGKCAAMTGNSGNSQKHSTKRIIKALAKHNKG